MNYGFNHEQLKKDWADFASFFTGFGKSFGPSAKKVKGKEIGFFEEMHIRFRLNLVEMGITKIIRTVIVIIVGLIIVLPLFINSQLDMRLIIAFLFIIFYGWMMMDHLVVDKKPIDTTAKLIVGVHDFGLELFAGIKTFFADVFGAINPFPKSEK
jgi:hypothetical protein